MKKFLLIFVVSIIVQQSINAQIGIGYVTGFDIYQRLKNPIDEDVSNVENSVGSTLINYSIGPKVWLGNSKYSMSLEGQINFGILAFDRQNYRGLGSISIPLLFKLNNRGMSGFSLFPIPGISLGGGIQYNLTDLLFVSDEDKESRGEWFRTYVFEIGLGLGTNGKDGSLYVRYGFGDGNSSALHIGILKNLNFTMNKKSKKKKEKDKELKSLPLPI